MEKIYALSVLILMLTGANDENSNNNSNCGFDQLIKSSPVDATN